MNTRSISYCITLVWAVILGMMVRIFLANTTDHSLLSPWQTIPESAVYLTAGSLFLLGSLIAFSRFPAWLLVIMVSLQTLVMHSYLPLSHEFFYGADGWRHIASVERISAGLPLTDAATITSGRTWLQYLNPGIIAYSHLWCLMLFLHVFGFSFIKIIAWLVPVLWSVIVPITMFKLGKELRWSDRTAHMASFATLIPFALVAGGSFTLPNSLGFIVFVPSLIVLVRRLKTGERVWAKWLLMYGLFLLSGYTLYAILFWMMWGIAEVCLLLSLRAPTQEERGNLSGSNMNLDNSIIADPTRLSRRGPKGLRRSSRFGSGLSPRNDKLIKILLLLVCIFSIPTLELVSGYSHLPASPKIVFSGIKQFIGNLSGFYLANGPRPHAIATGNILVYQTPGYAFVPNLLTDSRYWIFLISAMLWAVVCIGVWRGLRSSDRVECWLAAVTLGFFASYGIGRYLLAGEQILSRRMDMLLALFALLAVVHEGARRLEVLKVFIWQRYYVLGLIAMLAAFGGAVYSLGPVDRALSRDEYRVAEYIGQAERGNRTGHYCVMADTYPLLALEALTAKRIVGGGFPIDQYFRQTEREGFYTLAQRGLRTEDLAKALALTGARTCWLVVPPSQEVPLGVARATYGILSVWQSSVFKP